MLTLPTRLGWIASRSAGSGLGLPASVGGAPLAELRNATCRPVLAMRFLTFELVQEIDNKLVNLFDRLRSLSARLVLRRGLPGVRCIPECRPLDEHGWADGEAQF